MLQPPPPPPPSRLSFPQSDVDRQALQGLGAGAGAEAGAAKGQQGHSLRTSQYAEGGGSPAGAQATGRAGCGLSADSQPRYCAAVEDVLVSGYPINTFCGSVLMS